MEIKIAMIEYYKKLYTKFKWRPDINLLDCPTIS